MCSKSLPAFKADYLELLIPLTRKMNQGPLEKWLDLRLGHEIYKMTQAPVAYAYNPIYSGGRNQEYQGSKPAWANSS
jgi:hypothetical protein